MKKVKMISMILIFCMLCSACGGTSEEVAPIHTDNTETNKLAPLSEYYPVVLFRGI